MECAHCGADSPADRRCASCGGDMRTVPPVSKTAASHHRAIALAVVGLVVIALAARSAASERGHGIPDCEAIGTGTHNEACYANDRSDKLRAKVLDECGLADAVLEENWWQDDTTSIQFNYRNAEGASHGASLDVDSGDITCS